MRERQHRPEVEIMREHNVLVSNCPIHYLLVTGPRVPNIGPVH